MGSEQERGAGGERKEGGRKRERERRIGGKERGERERRNKDNLVEILGGFNKIRNKKGGGKC